MTEVFKDMKNTRCPFALPFSQADPKKTTAAELKLAAPATLLRDSDIGKVTIQPRDDTANAQQTSDPLPGSLEASLQGQPQPQPGPTNDHGRGMQ